MHLEVLNPQLLEIIQSVCADPEFSQFRLGGGSALALQLGHRKSVDAGFVAENFFDVDYFIALLEKKFTSITDVNSGKHGLFFKVSGIKVDLLSWNITFIRNAVKFDNLILADVEEIIAMKLFSILQRGEKKDYMDIASLLDHYSLRQMITFYKERHNGSDDLLVIRYLSSYSDIEQQPEPVMLNGLDWKKCKAKLINAIQEFMNE